MNCKELKSSFDINTTIDEVKKIVGANCSLLYKKTRKMFEVVAPRDFVTYALSNIEQDGTLRTVEASTIDL